MKFYKLFLILFLGIFVLSSCNKATDITDTIPANANYVMYLNTKSLVEKSNYDLFKNRTVQQGLSMYKAFIRDEKKIPLLDNFLRDANSLGVNLKGDVYLFLNEEVVGLVMGVNDAKALKRSLSAVLNSENSIEKEKGIYYLPSKEGLFISWNDDKVLVISGVDSFSELYNNRSSINLKELAISLMKQESENSIKKHKAFTQFLFDKQDISMLYSIQDGNINILQDDLLNLVSGVLKPFEGMSVGVYTSFEKGEIKISSKYYYDTPEVEEKYKSSMAKVSGSLIGNHLKYIPSKPLLVATMNMKGRGISDYIESIGVSDEIKNEFTKNNILWDDILSQIKNINGDVTFVLSAIGLRTNTGYHSSIPEVGLMIDVADAHHMFSFLKREINKNIGSYRQISPTVISVQDDDMIVYFGIRDNMLFFANSKSLYSQFEGAGSGDDQTALIKNKMAFVYGNTETLGNLLMNNRKLRTSSVFLDEIQSYNLSVSSVDYSGEGYIEVISKEINSMEALCLQIDKVILSLVSSYGF